MKRSVIYSFFLFSKYCHEFFLVWISRYDHLPSAASHSFHTFAFFVIVFCRKTDCVHHETTASPHLLPLLNRHYGGTTTLPTGLSSFTLTPHRSFPFLSVSVCATFLLRCGHVNKTTPDVSWTLSFLWTAVRDTTTTRSATLTLVRNASFGFQPVKRVRVRLSDEFVLLTLFRRNLLFG